MDAMEIRRNAIVELVNKYGTVSFSQIKEQFSNVSEMTLRTDLKALDEAKEIVLKDAGVSEKDISGIRIKLEKDDGIWQYEVDFYAGDKEYDYNIDADTGKILSKDMEIDDDLYWNGSRSGKRKD